MKLDVSHRDAKALQLQLSDCQRCLLQPSRKVTDLFILIYSVFFSGHVFKKAHHIIAKSVLTDGGTCGGASLKAKTYSALTTPFLLIWRKKKNEI